MPRHYPLHTDPERPVLPSLRRIILAAAWEFNIPIEAACCMNQNLTSVELRGVIALMAAELTSLPYRAIARAINRHPQTVMDAIAVMKFRMKGDPVLAAKIGRIRSNLLGRAPQ